MEQTQQVEQELVQEMNKTDFGHILYEYRKSFFVAIVFLVVGLIGLVFYKQMHQKSLDQAAEDLYVFEQTYFSPYIEGKLQLSELETAFNALPVAVLKSPAMVPLCLTLTAKLKLEGQLKEALMIVEKVKAQYSAKDITAHMLAYQVAVLKEDLGDIDASIETLEALLKQDDKTFGPKLYLDLGRLYIAKGNKDMATKNLNHVLESFPGEELAGIAEVYLQQIR